VRKGLIAFAIFLCPLAFDVWVLYSRMRDPDMRDPDVLFEQARNAAGRGDYQAAVNWYSKAIAINPNNPVVYNNRGDTYFDLQNYDQAIADHTKAIELDLNYSLAYFHRGIAYNRLQKYDQAIADYTQAIALNPKRALYYKFRADAYNELKNYDQARKDSEKACELGDCQLLNDLNHQDRR
jgi:tetratricopeptide (TPR) repeat protein